MCELSQHFSVTGEELPSRANVSDRARADVSAIGLWQPLSRAFLDIKVFNPLALSNTAKDIQQVYRKHQQEKKAQYNARILEVEKGSFTPVIFSCSGGASAEATRQVIAGKLSSKRQESSYATTMNFVRRRLSFDILRTCVISFRGERGARREFPIEDLDFGLQEMEVYK